MSANVNKPTDVQKKEADVNRKLQVYGIISAFQLGKVPSVRQPIPTHARHEQLPRVDQAWGFLHM